MGWHVSAARAESDGRVEIVNGPDLPPPDRGLTIEEWRRRWPVAIEKSELVCPCHGATFALTGEIVHYDLPVEIPPLPVYQAREQDGDIQIYTPFKRA